MRPKILFIDSVHPNCSDILQKSGFECFNTEGKDNNWIKEEMLSFDAVVIRSRFKITKDLLLGNKHLKCIARAGAGMENIDVEFAESIGIRCVHVPEANRDAVAEHAIGMILMLFNRLNIADSEVRKGLWRREQNRGIELKGKKVGIIGYGNMGSAFAQRLLGFDVEILAYDKYKTEYGNEKIRECNMEELYENCDVISLHLPLTEETNQLVDEKWINKFHKPFYLINTARGKCVNSDDLVNALNQGKILGACLDVLEYESVSFEKLNLTELPKSFNQLTYRENVVFSPHIAGWTHESNLKIAEMLAKKIIEAIK